MSDLIKNYIKEELSQLTKSAAEVLNPEEFAQTLVSDRLGEAHLKAIVDEAQKVLGEGDD